MKVISESVVGKEKERKKKGGWSRVQVKSKGKPVVDF